MSDAQEKEIARIARRSVSGEWSEDQVNFWIEQLLSRACAEARAEEREACVKIAERAAAIGEGALSDHLKAVAAALRARGEADREG